MAHWPVVPLTQRAQFGGVQVGMRHKPSIGRTPSSHWEHVSATAQKKGTAGGHRSCGRTLSVRTECTGWYRARSTCSHAARTRRRPSPCTYQGRLDNRSAVAYGKGYGLLGGRVAQRHGTDADRERDDGVEAPLGGGMEGRKEGHGWHFCCRVVVVFTQWKSGEREKRKKLVCVKRKLGCVLVE